VNDLLVVVSSHSLHVNAGSLNARLMSQPLEIQPELPLVSASEDQSEDSRTYLSLSQSLRNMAVKAAVSCNTSFNGKGPRHRLCPSSQLPLRKLTVWVHAPSQPLMQSPLSRSQTPAASRKAVGFFGSGCLPSCPGKLITRPTSDWPNIDSANPFGHRQLFSLGVVRSRVNCPFLVQFPKCVGCVFVSGMDLITHLPVAVRSRPSRLETCQ
jgi:hypothetical protein